jgi:hypothetical protein
VAKIKYNLVRPGTILRMSFLAGQQCVTEKNFHDLLWEQMASHCCGHDRDLRADFGHRPGGTDPPGDPRSRPGRSTQ